MATNIFDNFYSKVNKDAHRMNFTLYTYRNITAFAQSRECQRLTTWCELKDDFSKMHERVAKLRKDILKSYVQQFDISSIYSKLEDIETKTPWVYSGNNFPVFNAANKSKIEKRIREHLSRWIKKEIIDKEYLKIQIYDVWQPEKLVVEETA